MYIVYGITTHKAYKDAIECSNICPVCNRLVCNNCFHICRNVDVCKDCAEKLGEKGEKVKSTD